MLFPILCTLLFRLPYEIPLCPERLRKDSWYLLLPPPVPANSSNPYPFKGKVDYSNISGGKSKIYTREVLFQKRQTKVDALPVHVKLQLPAVAKTFLYAPLNENEYVNFKELLLNNRTPSTVTGDKTIVQDFTTGKFKVKLEGKKDVVDSFMTWSRAFSVFMAYQIAVNPNLALPLTKYFDHISQLAQLNRRFSLTHWLNYDKHLRLHTARNPEEVRLWSFKNEDACTEYLSAPTFTTNGPN